MPAFRRPTHHRPRSDRGLRVVVEDRRRGHRRAERRGHIGADRGPDRHGQLSFTSSSTSSASVRVMVSVLALVERHGAGDQAAPGRRPHIAGQGVVDRLGAFGIAGAGDGKGDGAIFLVDRHIVGRDIDRGCASLSRMSSRPPSCRAPGSHWCPPGSRSSRSALGHLVEHIVGEREGDGLGARPG